MTDLVPNQEIRPAVLSKALSERYVAYALSTITSRSLPDVRDGLKPVHRRILFAMRQLKLDPNSGFKKCARVIGDVIGKYHPHGDQSVYDALVRLAQDFAVRYPLVDGQGNFGNIDGDNAAAMRYTEARMTIVAQALLDGIDENAVDFRENYDGEDEEPVVLPARFPNLLANGASGIAVGMATSIPPHNVGEICDALVHLLKFSRATIAKLGDYIRGPDFPTGGVIVEPRDNIIEAYATGRGSFRTRATWEVEKLSHGQYQIVISEIPYQVSKARLVERIAELIGDRKLAALADVRDESAEDIRLILEPRSRTIAPETLMESVFRATELETRIGLNMNVLDAERMPRVMNLRDVLQAFIDHRLVILKRRTQYRLDQIEHRLEVLTGYLIAYLNLDEIISIIREKDEPKPILQKRFKLSEVQAEAILNMRLRALRRLEEMQIREEHARLGEERKDLKRLLKDPKQQTSVIAAEIKDIRKTFTSDPRLGARRTRFDDAPEFKDVALETLVEREPVTIVCSDKGWIRALKGHLGDDADLKYKEGDHARFLVHAHTTDKLMLFATNGRFYTLACDKIPGGRGHGEPIRLVIDLGNDEDIVQLLVHRPDRKLLVASSDGRGFVVPEDTVIAQTRSGKQVLNVRGDVEARVCVSADGDAVAVVGTNRKMTVFGLDELPEMNRGRGVLLQRYKDGELSDVNAFTKADGLSWRSGGRTRTETDLAAWVGKRSQAGRLVPRGFPKSNRFA